MRYPSNARKIAVFCASSGRTDLGVLGFKKAKVQTLADAIDDWVKEIKARSLVDRGKGFETSLRSSAARTDLVMEWT